MHLIITTNQIYFVSETDGTLISVSEKLQALWYKKFFYFIYCTLFIAPTNPFLPSWVLWLDQVYVLCFYYQSACNVFFNWNSAVDFITDFAKTPGRATKRLSNYRMNFPQFLSFFSLFFLLFLFYLKSFYVRDIRLILRYDSMPINYIKL